MRGLPLTPGLLGVFLGKLRGRAKGCFFKLFNDVFNAGASFYQSTVRRAMDWRLASLLLFFALLGCTYWLYQRVPRAFIPEDDQGYLMFIVQAPQGASLTYTRDVCGKAEEVIARDPEIDGVFTVVGFGAAGSSSNQAILYANLRPFEKRKGTVHSPAAALGRLRGSLSAVTRVTRGPVKP